MNYLTDPIGKLYQKLVPSAIGSMLTATVASLIDTVILSYFLGPEMLSSVSICMPIYMILNALALLISSGYRQSMVCHRNPSSIPAVPPMMVSFPKRSSSASRSSFFP